MRVMALTVNAGLRLRADAHRFFFTDVMLCASVIHIIMTIAARAVMLGVGHSDVLEISIYGRRG